MLGAHCLSTKYSSSYVSQQQTGTLYLKQKSIMSLDEQNVLKLKDYKITMKQADNDLGFNVSNFARLRFLVNQSLSLERRTSADAQ
jgi:hypothetical protein